MLRNALILFASAALLLTLFAGYLALVQDSGAADPAGLPTAGLPSAQDAQAPEVVHVGDFEAPAGKAMEFTLYDERTGVPRQSFRCRSYTPVPGSKNEVFVTGPELITRLPSGMVAAVSADHGQIVVERVDNARGRPKLGWLEGSATIRLDRRTTVDRPPVADRPEDLITIEMERMEFDLGLGTLRTDGPIVVRSDPFDLVGTGLSVVWSDVENRVETLEIARGERIDVALDTGLFEPAAEARTAVDARPLDDSQRSARPRQRAASYLCRLTGGVRAERHAAGPAPDGTPAARPAGTLEADELELRFDPRGSGDDVLAARSQGGRSPASRPAGPRERLVVRWDGPLTLVPAPLLADPGHRVRAVGEAVTLRTGESVVRCGELTYHDGDRRLWLKPSAGGRVRIDQGSAQHTSARTIFYDGSRNVVKLVGDVEIVSRGADGRRTRIECDDWAELDVAAPPGGVDGAEGALAAADVRAARLVGRVRIDAGGRRVSADQIDAYFAEPGDANPSAARSLPERFERLVARGDVRMRAEGRLIEAAWLEAHMNADAAGEPFARLVEARGRVRLRDPRRGFAAAGDHLTAQFRSADDLENAAILGPAGADAIALAEGYTLRGRSILIERADPERDALTARVPGRSTLRYRDTRGLRGVAQSAAAGSTTVHARDQLLLDLTPGGGTIRFDGGVRAVSGDEQLIADRMTLELGPADDAPAAATGPAAPRRGVPRALGEWTFGRPLVALIDLRRAAAAGWERIGAADPRLRSSAFATALGVPQARESSESTGGFGRMRREPVRLVAHNAVVQSESRIAGDSEPLVHESVVAAEMEVDLRARVMRTRGRTDLYLVDRRLTGAADGAADSLGVPSALMTRGPSQSVLRCEKAMTYVLGPEGARRADRVLFDGAVQLRHVAGREMVQIESMLPQVQQDPGLLDRLPARNTYLESDRLEVELVSDLGDADPRAQPRRGGLQMSWLSAAGRVYVRDQQRDLLRSLEAARVEFDRAQGVIRVYGGAASDARVYNENLRTGVIDVPVVSREVVIDLQSNTIRAGRIRGEARSR